MSQRGGLSSFYNLRLREFAGKKREYSRYIKNAKNYISELQQDKKAVNRNHRIQKEEQRLKDLEYALKYLKEVEKERKAEVNRHNNNQRYRR